MVTTHTLFKVNTRTCNLDCGYCYQGSHQYQEGGWQDQAGLTKHMTAEISEAAMHWAADWTTRGLKVIWYGGEPLINLPLMKESMPKWNAHFKQQGKGLEWSVTTNGVMLNAANREFLDEMGCDVLLSLDGPANIHNRQRTYYGGGGSWHRIPIKEILAWRPNIEIAWQIDPSLVPNGNDLDYMLMQGFKRINFNLNWLKPWSAESQIALQDLFQHVARRYVQAARRELFTKKSGELEVARFETKPSTPAIEFNTNMMAKFHETYLKVFKPLKPCGTSERMAALTPEGYLYPSQEMAFKAFEPGVAPGTAEYYRIGDVRNSPVIDVEQQRLVNSLETREMKPAPEFNCDDCPVAPVCVGSCHCRNIGQNGSDPSYRYDVAPGWCQSMRAALRGMTMGAKLEHYVTLRTTPPERPGAAQPQMSGHYTDAPNGEHGSMNSNTRIDFAAIEGGVSNADLYNEILKLKKTLKTDNVQELIKLHNQVGQLLKPIAKDIKRRDK